MFDYDIVPVSQNYRGMDRLLKLTDFPNNLRKCDFNRLLDLYFEYIQITCCEPPTKENFLRVKELFNLFIDYNVQCELIVFSDSSISNVYGIKMKFLGIDISRANSRESILVNMKNGLNSVGLCDTEDDAFSIINSKTNSCMECVPYWIYSLGE